MKTHAVRLVICLALGALVTLGSTWGLAFAAGPPRGMGRSSVHWPVAPGSSRLWCVSVERASGRSVVRGYTIEMPQVSFEALLRDSGTSRTPLQLLPAWSCIRREALEGPGRPMLLEVGYGWPWLALSAVQRTQLGAPAPAPTIVHGHATSRYAPPDMDGVLPTRLLTRGFLADTGLAALVLWTAWSTVLALRRLSRRRRNLCRACGYPQGVSDVCPECGAAAARRARGRRTGLSGS